MRIRFLPVAAALATIATAVPALSAPDDRPSNDAVLEQVAQLYRKARALHTDAKWAEAEAAYQAAWDLRHTFDIAGNLGDCELRVGQPREAAEHLTYALANFPAGGTALQKDTLNQRIAEAKRQIGTVRVRLNVTGAQVVVNGRAALELPEGVVFVDPGTSNVEVRRAGYEAAHRTITAKAGSAQDVAFTLVPTSGPSLPLLIGGGALAGVGVVMGAVFAGVSNGKASSATEQKAALVKTGGPAACTGAASTSAACTDLSGAANARRTFANVAFWSFVGAGAVGAGTLVYGLTASKGAPKTGVLVMPAAGPQGAGIEIRGTW